MRHNQNRRSRGRSRKGPNPLTRSYESNGPDVKVRGTAAHVAEKYMSLARDALSAGDNVSGENYLQHAEHYNRIVQAAQAQFQQQVQPQFRDSGEEGYDDDRQANGRMRDRFDYNGGGRGDGDEGPDSDGDDEPRSDRHEPRPRSERAAPQEAADPASEPQPSLHEPAAAASDERAAAPRRRRRPPKSASEKTEKSAEAQDADSTKDGAAALAAFPE